MTWTLPGNKLLHNHGKKDYKNSSSDVFDEVTAIDKKAAEDLDLEDRVPITEKREAFGTLKEGKEDFNSNPKMRLLNPCKLENLGWLSLLAHLPVVVGLYRHDGAVLSRLNPRETK